MLAQARGTKPLQFPTFIVLALALVCSGILLALTVVQYDGFEFDRPVDLKPAVDSNVYEFGGWALVNQRLRYGLCILAVLFTILGMMSLYRAIAALVFPVAVALFILGWVALAATVMDSMDVHDARDKFCDMQNVTCEGPQYIATCVFDAFVCFLLLVCAVLLFAFQRTSHSTSSSSPSSRSRPVAVDEDGVPVTKATKKQDEMDDARAVLSEMRPTLGIMVRNTDADGVDVTEVIAGKSADAAGIRQGDVILSIGKMTTNDHDDFDMVMAEAFPGETEDVVVVRDGARKQMHITFGGVYNGEAYSKKDINKLRKKAGKSWVSTQESRINAIPQNM